MKKRWRSPDELVHHDMPPVFCPSCFTLLDAVTALTGIEDKPVPGDYTICIECAQVLKYDADMSLQVSSLMDIPMHSRMGFARVVTEVKERGFRRWRR